MKYILDTHKITASLLSGGRRDLYTLQETAEEFNPGKKGFKRIEKSSIQILTLKNKHMLAMVKLMADHGDDYELISLFEGEGLGDVAILSYVLGEKLFPEGLFDQLENPVIISDDIALKKYARIYDLDIQSHP